MLIAVAAALVNNVVLSQFLGLCPFIGVSKKTDTAVGRNKIKRRAKNIIDNNKNTIQNGYDYVIIVRKGILELTYKDMEKELLKLIKSIGD